jgi:hypothetical protein
LCKLSKTLESFFTFSFRKVKSAQGVRLIKLHDKDKVSCVAPVIAEAEE